MRSSNNKKWMCWIGICLTVFWGNTRVVYSQQEIKAPNGAATENVDIEIEQFTIVDGKKKHYEENPKLLPGERISLIPRIKNNGNPCYIRAKLQFGTNADIEEDLKAAVYGMDEKWQLSSDGFYYFEEALENGEVVELFQEICIADDISQEYENTELELKLQVDAVQSSNPEMGSVETGDRWLLPLLLVSIGAGMMVLYSLITRKCR